MELAQRGARRVPGPLAGAGQPGPRARHVAWRRTGPRRRSTSSREPPPDVPAPGLPLSLAQFDVEAVRRDFPILAERVNGRQLVWLDNAATTHKPQVVIDRLVLFYARENSNIHRGAHALAARATDAYECAARGC